MLRYWFWFQKDLSKVTQLRYQFIKIWFLVLSICLIVGEVVFLGEFADLDNHNWYSLSGYWTIAIVFGVTTVWLVGTTLISIIRNWTPSQLVETLFKPFKD